MTRAGQYSAKLEKKLGKLIELEAMINDEYKKDERREYAVKMNRLARLLRKRGRLELDIHDRLEGGRTLEDPLLDYCFMNFSSTEYGESALRKAGHVKEFISQVNEMKGQGILTLKGLPLYKGIIRGSYFSSEGNQRELFVSVGGLLEYSSEDDTWEDRQEEREGLISIRPDLFSHHQADPMHHSIAYGAKTGEDSGFVGYSWSTTRFPGYEVHLGDELVRIILERIL